MARRKPGLGWSEHELRRKRLLPYVIGTPCPECGVTLTRQQGTTYRPTDAEFDHHGTTRAEGGRYADRFVCARCNRAAGARLGNARRKRPLNTSDSY